MIFGVLPQKKNQYALRILGNCGEFTSEELLRLSELTAKFGNGKITATSRGTFELNVSVRVSWSLRLRQYRQQNFA